MQQKAYRSATGRMERSSNFELFAWFFMDDDLPDQKGGNNEGEGVDGEHNRKLVKEADKKPCQRCTHYAK